MLGDWIYNATWNRPCLYEAWFLEEKFKLWNSGSIFYFIFWPHPRKFPGQRRNLYHISYPSQIFNLPCPGGTPRSIFLTDLVQNMFEIERKLTLFLRRNFAWEKTVSYFWTVSCSLPRDTSSWLKQKWMWMFLGHFRCDDLWLHSSPFYCFVLCFKIALPLCEGG